MELKTPSPLRSKHQALCAELNRAVDLDGSTGKATRLVARLMERHFAREEEFALPPLGLLPALAEGELEQEMAAAVTMAATLHGELPNLLAEQRVIAAALEELLVSAQREGHPELASFAESLLLHEESERQLSYPAAILIGKYLQLRLKA
ncbi:MAG: hypothetical protein ACYC7B_03235 [Burkholderiales bacterium]